MVVPRALMGVNGRKIGFVRQFRFSAGVRLGVGTKYIPFLWVVCNVSLHFLEIEVLLLAGPIFCPYIWSANRKSRPAPPGRFDVIMYGDRLEQVALMPRSGNQISKSHVGTLINPTAAFW